MTGGWMGGRKDAERWQKGSPGTFFPPACSQFCPLLPDIERDKQLAEAKKESKALKADQAAWAKTQMTLELQVWSRGKGWVGQEA